MQAALHTLIHYIMKQILPFIFFGLVYCGSGGVSLTNQSKPVLQSQTPANVSIIAENTVLTLTYDRDISDATLGGSLAGSAVTTTSGKTLTVSPASTWPTGTGQGITITAKTANGAESETLDLSYDVYSYGNRVYVSQTHGADANPGTSSQTKQTISSALSLASSGIFSQVTIQIDSVAGGYDLGSNSLSLVEGVSLEGGYNFNGTTWSGPNPTANETIIRRSSGTGGSISAPLATLACIGQVSASTTVSNLTFYGVDRQYTAAASLQSGCSALLFSNRFRAGIPNASSGRGLAVYVSSSATPTLRSNTLDPNSHTSGAINFTQVAAIIIDNANPVIERNTLLRGVASQAGTSTAADGIDVRNQGAPTIRNNLIYGGFGNLLSRAIVADNATPAILNNTIVVGRVSGASNLVQGIFVRNGASPDIRNNIITRHSSTTNNSNCIEESSTAGSHNPQNLANNGLFNCSTLYKDRESGQSFNTICSGNFGLAGCATVLSTPTGSDNTSADPLFTDLDGTDNDITTATDNDLTLNGGSTYRTSGLNLISLFSNDFAGTNRAASPTLWTIGAYE